MNRLETISNELKTMMAKYNTQSVLGHLSFLMTCITNGTAQDELCRMVSPMRQLYYLAALLMTGEADGTGEIEPEPDDWQKIVDKLVEIEGEYYNMFLPDTPEEVTDEWKKKVAVAMPTFLSYFNLGPLNFEEQVIEQIEGTYTSMNDVIEKETNLKVEDLLLFYDNLEAWCQYNFQSLGGISKDCPLRANWKDYTNLEIGVIDEAPEEIRKMGEERAPMLTLVKDPGIKNRFRIDDLATNGLSQDKVQKMVDLLSLKREQSDFLYYTELNPLAIRPIADLGNGMYQVFEEKRVLHAIIYLLDEICKKTSSSKARLTHNKGHYLEDKLIELFRKFLVRRLKLSAII